MNSALTAPASTSDKRVTFAPEAKSSSSATVPDDWGFRFVVEPLRGVHFRVVRELELICRFGGRARSGIAPSAAGTTYGPQVGVGDVRNTSIVSRLIIYIHSTAFRCIVCMVWATG